MKYIEDYVQLFATTGTIRVSSFDQKIAHSLGWQCYENKAFTVKQSEIALRLLKKYSQQFVLNGHKDLEQALKVPLFKHTLRVIDKEKSVTVDYSAKKFILKFPFDQELVTELRKNNGENKLFRGSWDNDNKRWDLELNEISLQYINSKLIPRGFVVSDEIKDLLDQMEKITAECEKYIPMLLKTDGIYHFKNIKTDYTSDNLLLALMESFSLGVYVFDDTVSSELESLIKDLPLARIFGQGEKQNYFASSKKYDRVDVIRFIQIFNEPVAIFLDENLDGVKLKSWIDDMESAGVSRSEIGVFFRRKNEAGGKEFNQAIKDLDLNKDVDDDKVKWYFLGSKYPKSLLRHKPRAKVCLFENRYVSTHHSVLTVMRNSLLSIQYNEHQGAEEHIVKL